MWEIAEQMIEWIIDWMNNRLNNGRWLSFNWSWKYLMFNKKIWN